MDLFNSAVAAVCRDPGTRGRLEGAGIGNLAIIRNSYETDTQLATDVTGLTGKALSDR